MTHLSLPTFHTSHAKEADRKPKGERKTYGNVIIEQEIATQTTPESTAVPGAGHNKLRKRRPFSISVPSSQKGSNSASSTPSVRSISVTMPLSISSSEESTSEDKSTLLAAPAQGHTGSKRLRTISLLSLRSISMGHNQMASAFSKQSTKDGDRSSSVSVSSASTSPSVSPVKKMTTKMKKSIHRIRSHFHVTHKPSSSSTSSLDYHCHPSQASISTTSFPTTSSSFTEVSVNANTQENKAEGQGEQERIPESILLIEELAPGDSDELLPESLSLVASTALDPAAEMPVTSQDFAFPMPVVANAEIGDAQPEEIGLPFEHALSASVYVEQEVSDPFLIDEESDAIGGKRESSVAPSIAFSAAAQKITPDVLATNVSVTDVAAISLPAISELLDSSPPNVDKDVPPSPHEEPAQQVGEGKEEVPDFFLPGLITPTMLLPIPNTDPLTTLLTKYIYPSEKRPVRDMTGEWQRTDIHTLVMTNSWRTLGRMAKDRIVTSDPSDVESILGLWYLRLASLARLRLSNQTAAECTNLFAVLNAIEPMEHRIYVFERILPFELEVMYARVKYWSNDYMGYLDALSTLLKKCKRKAREASVIAKVESEVQEIKDMWKERGARVSLILASQLVEMKDFVAATKLLEPLCTQSSTEGQSMSNPHLRSAIARIHIQSGNLQLAAYHFGIVAQDPDADEPLKRLNDAILSAARGEWETSVQTLKILIEEDADHFVAVNNLSVALSNQGKLKEAIDVLERALESSPSTVVVAEPFLFNLSTLYELRSATGLEKKKDLLIEVAKWSGDGLRVNCLKMPPT